MGHPAQHETPVASLAQVHTGIVGSVDQASSNEAAVDSANVTVSSNVAGRGDCTYRRACPADRTRSCPRTVDLPMCQTSSPAVQPGHAGTRASGRPSGRPRAGRGSRRRDAEQPIGFHPTIILRPQRGGQFRDRSELVELLVVVDVLVLPEQRVRDVHGVAAQASTGRMSLRTELRTTEAARRHVAPVRFCMVGNSVRSDILPVLALGGHAVHIPYPLLWEHEHVDHDEDLDELGSIVELPAALRANV